MESTYNKKLKTKYGLFSQIKTKQWRKKGFSPSLSWIYGLTSLFGIGILVVIFSQIFYQYLVPAIKGQVLMSNIDNATQTTIFANIDKYMMFWDMLGPILFFVVVIYLLAVSFRSEANERFN
jgi:hypothetical protein